MDKIAGPNIPAPRQFSETLSELTEVIFRLIELTKELDLKPIADNGYTQVYDEELGKCGFQASAQYERPSEFLQTLLDMIRVQFEPAFVGTFLLNSNIGFLCQEMPEEPFRLVYASLVSSPGQSFGAFFENEVSRHLQKCGYDEGQCTAMFAVATTGEARFVEDEFEFEIADTLKSGFSVDDALGLMAASIDPEKSAPRKQAYSGYCLDAELETRIRLSLWCYVKRASSGLQ